jgi:ADP-ribosyl-[dinitrogen reductase] hydrolase
MPGDATELLALLRSAVTSDENGQLTSDFARSLGLKLGVTGYTYHTAPAAVHSWLSFPNDFRESVIAVIECGGDADTTAAIVGGIVGARFGREGIPAQWLTGILEWPRSVSWMQSLGKELAISRSNSTPSRALSVNPVAIMMRNILFLAIVLSHGFRRLGPPYKKRK